MPFVQLRQLIVSLIESDDDAVNEFDAQPTTYRPARRRGPPPPPRPKRQERQATLDELIASLSRD